mmetsp:Transcript_30913/g.69656  ORF Transcript_30913/g.69656 Transcript_30913/m.69656 type:complete len:136 (-) Transcript_30913:40-447(-)
MLYHQQLVPMQELNRYISSRRLIQPVKWNQESLQYVFSDKTRGIIYRALLDPAKNPAPYLNDALYGKYDGESEEYAREDVRSNAFTMVPCLRPARQKGKVEFASVWYYPRSSWRWNGKEQEVTCGYHWPLEDWMR